MKMKEAYSSMKEFFKFYNKERLHQALDYKSPEYIYHSARSEEKQGGGNHVRNRVIF